MAVNIVIEDNLKNVKSHSTIFKYDENNKKDLLSKSDTDLVVIFEDNKGNVYPDGKIEVSKDYTTSYKYEYEKDNNGNVVKCVVTESHNQNSESSNYDKTSKVITYNGNGELIKEEFYTREGVMYKRIKYWYYGNGVVSKSETKDTHTITTKEYRPDGQLEISYNKTIKSHAIHTNYKATFDKDGNITSYLDNDKHMKVFIERDFDRYGKMISLSKRFYKPDGTKYSLFSTYTETYNPYNDYRLTSIIKNGFTVEKRYYNLKGELIKMWTKEDGIETMTKISRTVDQDTGNTIVETHKYITNNDNKTTSKYIQEIYDAEGKLLSYATDNSKVTVYTYDDERRRLTAITKQLVNDEFIVIDEITYEYITDEETGQEIKTRTEVRYDANGNMINKKIHKTRLTDSDTEKEYVAELEERKYKVPTDDNE